MHPRHHLIIYHSWKRVYITLFFIALPFVFLLLFGQFKHLDTGTLLFDTLTSSWRILVAYVISAIIGWSCAALFYRGKIAAIALPAFDVLQSIPTFAALPLVIVLWGASDALVIFFLIMEIMWPIFFSTVSSLKLMRPDWEEAAKIYDLKGIPYLTKFLWPISLPGLVTGSIVGLGDGWQALIATELLVHLKYSLGNFFAGYATDTTITLLGMLGFLLLVFSINKLIWLPLLDWSHERIEE